MSLGAFVLVAVVFILLVTSLAYEYILLVTLSLYIYIFLFFKCGKCLLRCFPQCVLLGRQKWRVLLFLVIKNVELDERHCLVI